MQSFTTTDTSNDTKAGHGRFLSSMVSILVNVR
jgi:hypothetical protein